MKHLAMAALLSMAASLLSATPLQPGVTAVSDDQYATASTYTYTPTRDEMLRIYNRNNVNIVTSDFTPADQLYGESYRDTIFIQTHAGVEYTLTVNPVMPNLKDCSFEFDSYASPWPEGGESMQNPFKVTDRFGYVPVTLEMDTYLTYTPEHDGVVSMMFNHHVTLRVTTNPNVTNPDDYDEVLTATYQSLGGYKVLFLHAKGGTKYYFNVKSNTSYLCKAELVDIEQGTTPEWPFTVTAVENEVPAAAGTYYYVIPNPGESDYIEIDGQSDNFVGYAQLGLHYVSPQVESTNCIHLRYKLTASTTQYVLTITRTKDAQEPTKFTVTIPKRPTDLFPGLPITEGTYTTPDFNDTEYYYTFTVPTDGRSMIKVKGLNENMISRTTASLYFADNEYSRLASGEEGVECEGQPGRQYSLKWFTPKHDTPLTFSLEFVTPAAGESINNPLPAYAGQNAGASSAATTYFKYTATVDGWLSIKPENGTPAPAISMLPIPSDPHTQACEVLEVDGSYRAACTAGRGYLLIFNSPNTVNFRLEEISAKEGESASNPFKTVDDTATLPNAVGTFWFTYTTPRAGKLEVSTNMPFEITENRVDYSFVRLYSPSDPDNFLTQLRPDYDTHVFANRVINVEAGETFLIKVRTLTASDAYRVNLTMRDALPGEEPTVLIEIPFNGKSGNYTFDRPVNYVEDALWYSINLSKGTFTIKGTTGGAFEMSMYAPGDLTAPIAVTDIVDLDYDEDEEMYIYTYGIVDLALSESGTYLFKLTDNAVAVEMDLTLDADEDGIEEVCLPDGETNQWYDLQGRPATKGLLIRKGEKIFRP
ncbi:MAG: hypothetical protein NC301_03170 [Bacteroides sp.]|nr:hypothetical protein [Bacteroides sp.]MCM1378995.1 hypothetical protein [Bacteroides sp.]MCM1445611.1 hypothetical protein [Prevotella sp.]